jgi:hypothetical protein
MIFRLLKNYLLPLLLSLSLSTYADSEFNYIINDSGVEITSCVSSCPSELHIPSSIDGINVTHLGKDAFYSENITSVSIPNTLIEIGQGAFAYNPLSHVTIPDSVTHIGRGAFRFNNLTSVSIGNNVTYIDDGAFYTNQLTELIIPEGVTQINESAFASNKLVQLTLPSTLTSIGISGFYNNQLTAVAIPNNVVSISGGAFHSNQLVNLDIPESVTFIDVMAFGQNQLENIFFYGARPDINTSAFADNSNLQNIYFCSENSGWPGEQILGIDPVANTCIQEVSNTIDWDFDQNSQVDALTDGLLLLRYAFGLEGQALTEGAIAINSPLSSTDVENRIEQAVVIADIDDNGVMDALTDGLLLLRYTFGLRGDDLVHGATAMLASRPNPIEIEMYIQSHMPISN